MTDLSIDTTAAEKREFELELQEQIKDSNLVHPSDSLSHEDKTQF